MLPGEKVAKRRLGIFWIAPVYERDGRYTTWSYQHYQFGELARYFDVDLVTTVAVRAEHDATEVLDTSHVNILPLPFATGWHELYLMKLPAILRGMWHLFRSYRSCWDLLLVIDPDVHSQIALTMALILGIRVVLFVGGSYDYSVLTKDKYNRPRGVLWRALASMWALWLSRVTCLMIRLVPSVVTGIELYHKYQSPNRQIKLYISSLVHQKEIDPSCIERRIFEFGKLRLLAVCRLAPIKGLDYLIAALAMIDPALDVNVDVVGQGDPAYVSTLQQQIAHQGVGRRISLKGPVPHGEHLMKMYCSADAFVLPSLSEGTPKVLPEAMSKGLPIIATRVGGIPDLIGDSGCAILVPPADAVALAEAISRLACDLQLRRDMALRSLARADMFTIERQVAGLADFLISQCQGNNG